MFEFLIYPFFLILTSVNLYIVVDNLKRAKNIPQKICGGLSLIITLGYPILLFNNSFFYSTYGFVIPFSIEILLAWFFLPWGLAFLSNTLFAMDVFYKKEVREKMSEEEKRMGEKRLKYFLPLILVLLLILVLYLLSKI